MEREGDEFQEAPSIIESSAEGIDYLIEKLGEKFGLENIKEDLEDLKKKRHRE